jgi:hypothetical protein
MRGLGLLGLLVGCAWACSSEPLDGPGVAERPVPSLGARAGRSVGGPTAAGSALDEALSSAAGATSPNAGAAADEGGASGASEGGASEGGASEGGASEGGASGPSDGGEGGDPPKFDGDPCLDLSGRGHSATLSQLVGDWDYIPQSTDGDVEEAFSFHADGTGSMSMWLFGVRPGQVFGYEYSGTFEVTADEIVLHVTKESRSSNSGSSSTDVDETFEYPYAYNAKRDTLYVVETDCIDGKPSTYTRFP